MKRIMLPLTVGRLFLSGILLFGWTALVSTALYGCGGGGNPGTAVQIETLKETLAKDKETVVVDVRTEEELSGELGKLDGIIHIPLQELATRHGELAGFRDRNIYVICRSGNRSGTAAELLRSKGYRAINVEGGMRAWRKAYGVQNN